MARHAQANAAIDHPDKLYRMGQKDGLLIAAEAIEHGALDRLSPDLEREGSLDDSAPPDIFPGDGGRGMVLEGQNARGIWSSTGQGRNFHRRRRSTDALGRFADALSWHLDAHDIEAGENLATGEALLPNARPDPGGNPRVAARCAGMKPDQGNAMLQRIRRRLGPQAR